MQAYYRISECRDGDESSPERELTCMPDSADGGQLRVAAYFVQCIKMAPVGVWHDQLAGGS